MIQFATHNSYCGPTNVQAWLEGGGRWRGDERNLVVPFLYECCGAVCLLGEVVLHSCHFGTASPTIITWLCGPLNYDQAVTAISRPASLPTVESHFIIHIVGTHEIEIWSMDFACSTRSKNSHHLLTTCSAGISSASTPWSRTLQQTLGISVL